jgi:hypothetical protein
MIDQISLINAQYSDFIENYSNSMVKTQQFIDLINKDINDKNSGYFCNLDIMCKLNSKGFDSGIDIIIVEMQNLYKDYLNKLPYFTIDNMKDLFLSDESIMIHQQIEAIIWRISDESSQLILDDMNLVIQNVYDSILILGILCLVCYIFLVIYMFLGLLIVLKGYYSDFNYSCRKINRAIYF